MLLDSQGGELFLGRGHVARWLALLVVGADIRKPPITTSLATRLQPPSTKLRNSPGEINSPLLIIHLRTPTHTHLQPGSPTPRRALIPVHSR